MAQISIETWEEILQNVKEKSDIPDISFRTWIQPLKVQEVRGNTIAVLVTTGVMGVEYISKVVSALPEVCGSRNHRNRI